MSSIKQPSAMLLLGSEVADLEGKSLGRMKAYWLDTSTKRVAYIGVRMPFFPHDTHLVPASFCQVEDNHLIRAAVSPELLAMAPTGWAGSELSQVEQQQVNAHYRGSFAGNNCGVRHGADGEKRPATPATA